MRYISGFGFAHRQPADGDAVKADVHQAVQRLLAQVAVQVALHNAEQRVGVFQVVEGAARTLGPAQAHAHRLGGGGVVNLARRAFVEDHHDVRVQHLLDFHRLFRRQEQLVAVDRALEGNAFLGNLVHGAQAEYLEAAGVGEDGFVPADEVVQAAKLLDDLQARAQPQVESVAQNDLGLDVVQLVRAHRLHRAVGAYRLEDRGLHRAVVQFQCAPARAARGFVQGKLQHVLDIVRRIPKISPPVYTPLPADCLLFACQRGAKALISALLTTGT